MTTIIVSALLSSTAVAYSLQNAGFSATHYASGFAGGPRAGAWDGNVLWSVDASDGLYRADPGVPGPGPATSLTATRVNPAPIIGLTGVAVGSGGRVYVANGLTNEVDELDKTDGHTLRVVVPSSSVSPRAIATDPLTGDLLVAGATRIWRVSGPATAPVVSIYSKIASGLGTKAIAIGPDGTVFVVTDGGLLYWIESTAVAATHPGNAEPSPMGAPVAGIVGVSVVTNGVTPDAQFLMVTTSGGALYKVPGLGGSGDTILVLDGAGGGQQISTGPDRCAYPSMGADVLRVADAAGGCALAPAGIIPPALTIANVSGQDAHVNDGVQTVRATITNAATLPGHDITFTITGVNARTVHAITDAGGNAAISFTSSIVGLDTIVATSLVDGFPTTSNTLTIDWLRAIDTSTPTIAFSYTVPSGGQGSTFSCDTSLTSDTTNQVTCGWFTQYPTIHFTPTANGPSGLGSTAACGNYTLNYQPAPQGHHQTCTVQNGDARAIATLTVVIKAVVTPPAIIASATADGSQYSAGALTRWPVAVHFSCSSAISLSLQCSPDQTFSGTGSFTANGSSTDIAGQTSTASFGPIVIDATPPMVTVGSAPYSFGAWTNADVHLVFHCTDNDAVATCPGPLTVTSSTTGVTVAATDAAGNTTTFTTGAINIDRTPPTIVASGRKADGTTYAAATPTSQNVTVQFACGTDGAPVTCPADQTLSTSGTASGTATDAAGNSATASFVVVIDTTAPTISVAVTLNGAPYDGSWTQGPVLVHFTCADDNPGVICPLDTTLTSDQNAPATGIARDAASNTASVTTAVIKIDRTAPTTTSTVTGTLSGGVYLLSATVALAATDAGSGVASITYTVDGGAPTTVSGNAAAILLYTAGAHTVTYHATDVVGNIEADSTRSLTISIRQATALAITSGPFLATGTKSTAKLTAAGAPVAGETVRLTAGGVTRTAVTDATGVAGVDLGLAPGAYVLAASYAGSASFFPSDAAAQPVVSYAMTKFVVYAPNARLLATVQFYGSDWSKQIDDRDARKGFGDFKGYAETVFDAYWTARSGDSVKAPSSVPQYIAVLLTTSATKSRDLITGNVVGFAVIRVAASADDKDKGDDRKSKDGKDNNKDGQNKDGQNKDGRFGTVLNVVRR